MCVLLIKKKKEKPPLINDSYCVLSPWRRLRQRGETALILCLAPLHGSGLDSLARLPACPPVCLSVWSSHPPLVVLVISLFITLLSSTSAPPPPPLSCSPLLTHLPPFSHLTPPATHHHPPPPPPPPPRLPSQSLH